MPGKGASTSAITPVQSALIIRNHVATIIILLLVVYMARVLPCHQSAQAQLSNVITSSIAPGGGDS